MWPFWTERYTTYTAEDVHSRRFDYVIVGGGTGGCVLASRLSEDPNIKVLLIERGPIVDTWLSRVPLLSVDFRAASSPTYQWKSSVDGLFASGESMVAGKLLGGSSKINAFVYTRGIPGDFNAWAKAGRKDWDWDAVQPYFKKSEASLTHGHRDYRGSKGPWKNRELTEIEFKHSAELLDAADSLGIPRVPDVHDPAIAPYSCGRMSVTIDEAGRRVSTFDSFLPPKLTKSRSSNLTVCPNSVACRLNIQSTPDGFRAVGVYLKPDIDGEGSEYYVSASSEIVLCAGAIATPQILMLSGIGPTGHLQALKVPVTKDMPGVGSNLRDHSCVSVSYKVPKADTLHALETSPLLIVREVLRYVFTGRGLLLSPNPEIVIFALSKLLGEDSITEQTSESSDAHSPANIPDLELLTMPYDVFGTEKLDKAEGATTLVCVLLKPKSSGTVRLTSLDPRARPACDLGYLTHTEDYTVLRKGLRLSLALGRKCREQGYPIKDFRMPQSESDEDLDEYIRKSIRTTFHYSCTCRMAPEEEGGVVDDELRVHGVRGLRIADASVFPVIPSAHPQAPVVMVAERCADFIKKARVRQIPPQ